MVLQLDALTVCLCIKEGSSETYVGIVQEMHLAEVLSTVNAGYNHTHGFKMCSITKMDAYCAGTFLWVGGFGA